jgi:hypothetical protein
MISNAAISTSGSAIAANSMTPEMESSMTRPVGMLRAHAAPASAPLQVNSP